jgi:hypothetical protein
MDESTFDKIFGTDIFTTKEVYQTRKETCKNCEFVILKKMLCGKCFCAVPTIAIYKPKECPIGKWKSSES